MERGRAVVTAGRVDGWALVATGRVDGWALVATGRVDGRALVATGRVDVRRRFVPGGRALVAAPFVRCAERHDALVPAWAFGGVPGRHLVAVGGRAFVAARSLGRVGVRRRWRGLAERGRPLVAARAAIRLRVPVACRRFAAPDGLVRVGG
jgi:hypothetical protein